MDEELERIKHVDYTTKPKRYIELPPMEYDIKWFKNIVREEIKLMDEKENKKPLPKSE